MQLKKRTVQRNAKCPCGSGKKVKHCCLPQIFELGDRMEAGESAQSVIVDRIFRTKVVSGVEAITTEPPANQKGV